jgi:nucleotide-binding universal stress UspA family protein
MTYRILVPFELPDAAPVSRLLVESLAGMEVVLLGHYGLPEQTPPEAARDQFEETARAELDALAADFREAGIDVTTRLMFGTDRKKAIDQIAIEEGCDAELDPAPTEGIRRILVPLLDTGNLDRLAFFVHALLDDTTTAVTLFHVAETDEGVPAAEAMLEEAREAMIESGFDPDLVDVTAVDADGHDEAILQAAGEYDAVVMGEAAPDVAERIFGTLSDRIARHTGKPVILVRRPH